MNLNSAFLVGNTPKQKTVILPDGSDHVLYFNELPAHVFVTFREEQQSEDPLTRALAVPRLIAKSLCDENGELVLNDETCKALTPPGCRALMEAVMEVNSFDAKKPLPSEEAPGSDTSSP